MISTRIIDVLTILKVLTFWWIWFAFPLLNIDCRHFVKNEMPLLRVLNPSTSFDVAEIHTSMKADSIVFFNYGDSKWNIFVWSSILIIFTTDVASSEYTSCIIWIFHKDVRMYQNIDNISIVDFYCNHIVAPTMLLHNSVPNWPPRRILEYLHSIYWPWTFSSSIKCC